MRCINASRTRFSTVGRAEIIGSRGWSGWWWRVSERQTRLGRGVPRPALGSRVLKASKPITALIFNSGARGESLEPYHASRARAYRDEEPNKAGNFCIVARAGG